MLSSLELFNMQNVHRESIYLSQTIYDNHRTADRIYVCVSCGAKGAEVDYGWAVVVVEGGSGEDVERTSF